MKNTFTVTVHPMSFGHACHLFQGGRVVLWCIRLTPATAIDAVIAGVIDHDKLTFADKQDAVTCLSAYCVANSIRNLFLERSNVGFDVEMYSLSPVSELLPIENCLTR